MNKESNDYISAEFEINSTSIFQKDTEGSYKASDKFVNYERDSSPKSMPKVCKTIHKQYEQQFQLKVTKFKRSLTFNVI
ncbi:hypothetical protein T4B_15126 [Trichinella pseudospiralis]|uniref:Uncharacterized protein n=1 Tax=Trichinella pseudospiralis TaxID=6337 RepID=A0A0V1JDG5_TRIPS|nr:hypothetical protein T4B_15126 [Trichinella pseudospiralis]